jgi:Zn finger protein HypA/HybF involved in hydrogenase expression
MTVSTSIMLDSQKFKFVCDACGSMTIKVASPERAPETTIVECGRCHSPRGTLAALRDLARQGRSDLFEF